MGHKHLANREDVLRGLLKAYVPPSWFAKSICPTFVDTLLKDYIPPIHVHCWHLTPCFIIVSSLLYGPSVVLNVDDKLELTIFIVEKYCN